MKRATGRKTKAEELGKQPARAAFLKELPELGTIDDCISWSRKVALAVLRDIITANEAEALAKPAALALRALRAKQGRGDIDELHKLLADAKELSAGAAKRGAAERDKTH